MDRLKTKVITLIACLLLLQVLQADAEPIGGSDLSLDYISITKSLIGTWYDLLIDKTLSEEVHQHAARDLYGLLFQCWLTTEHQGKPIFIATNGIKNIVTQSKKYVSPSDPMSLDRLYEGNVLGDLGEDKVKLLPLTNGMSVFDDKENYHKLVAEFSKWIDTLK
jgi:hypothetical protein